MSSAFKASLSKLCYITSSLSSCLEYICLFCLFTESICLFPACTSVISSHSDMEKNVKWMNEFINQSQEGLFQPVFFFYSIYVHYSQLVCKVLLLKRHWTLLVIVKELNWSSKLRDMIDIKHTLVIRSCVLSDAWFRDLKI